MTGTRGLRREGLSAKLGARKAPVARTAAGPRGSPPPRAGAEHGAQTSRVLAVSSFETFALEARVSTITVSCYLHEI